MKKDNLGKARKKISIISAYKELFNTPLGRIVLFDLMKTHYMNSPVYDENVNLMLLREGERNVVLRILSRMKVDVTQLLKNFDEIEKQENE
jgi:hypothetical protein